MNVIQWEQPITHHLELKEVNTRSHEVKVAFIMTILPDVPSAFMSVFVKIFPH